MRKLLSWLDKNFLKIGISFLLFFIPLYPKLPLIDIKHTWVYIRFEDFCLVFLFFIFIIQLFRKRATLKSPLTIPIFLYWFVGGVSLLHAVLFLQPRVPDFFPSVAFLHFLRRVEYMILFFIAFSTIKNAKGVYHYLLFFALGVVAVILYGFGQKFLGLPAFSTMNEEYAKGIPLSLTPEARVVSTFAGHYDLAAYLVFVLALFGSLIFGVKKKWQRAGLLMISVGAYILLLFTASRVSFGVYLVTITLVLLLQRKKWLTIPVIMISILLVGQVKEASIRLGKTFRIRQIVFDMRTGRPIAPLEDFLTPTPTISSKTSSGKASREELPLGSGYLEVPLLERAGSLSGFRKITLMLASEADHLATTSGEFLVKRAIVYDIALTTRLQGTWPRALKALQRNFLLGSGYSSISLATDNSYLRALGETGFLGLASFLFILFIILLITRQSLRKMKSPFRRSVVIGIACGIFGLSLNALLVDIFEASKIAYILWVMVGMMVGLFLLSVKRNGSLVEEGISFLKKKIVAIALLFFTTAVVFYLAIFNYFVADDFIWLKGAATSKFSDIPNFFVNSKNFFYRPLIRVVFQLNYFFLGLLPHGYHLISFVPHFLNATFVYFIAFSLSESYLTALLSSFLFLLHPTHGETVFWISSYAGIFGTLFYLLSFYLFVRWSKEKRGMRRLFYIGSLFLFAFSLISWELAVTLPLVLAFYQLASAGFKISKKKLKEMAYILLYFVFPFLYFWLRAYSHARPLSDALSQGIGDLIFYFLTNLIGYFGTLVIGFHFIPIFNFIKEIFRNQKLIFTASILILFSILISFLKRLRRVNRCELLIFSLGWVIITLLPVVGLRNVTERYLYLPSVGFVIFLSLLIEKFFSKLSQERRKVKGFLKASLLIIIIFSVYGFYYLELKKSEAAWQESGERMNEILRAISTNYKQFPKESTLYFVNFPSTFNQAWVFPVGIKEGLWFIYRDETLNVKQGNDIRMALDFKDKNKDVYVFLYENRELKEVTSVP